jgi:hypothetical protein
VVSRGGVGEQFVSIFSEPELAGFGGHAAGGALNLRRTEARPNSQPAKQEMNVEPTVAPQHAPSPSIRHTGGMESVSHRAGLDGIWDDLVARSRNGHFMATRRFLDYHGTRFQDRSLLFLRGGKPIAVIALHEEGIDWFSHRGLPFGGLIAAPELTTEQTLAIFADIGMRMRAAGIATLRYTPTPHVYQAQPFEDDVFALHSLGAQLHSMKLAARARLPRLGLMQERVRKYLRQAVPRIRVEHGVALSEFWDGLTSYLGHRHEATPVHTEAEMADLMNRFPDEIKLAGVRDARRRLVAGSLVFLTERVIRFQYAFGAGDPAAPKQSLLALDQAAIKKFGAGRSWLDFGTSMRPADGTLDLRLHAQKERSGGRGMRVETWVWDGSER